MPRPLSKGLNYIPLDVSFFYDRKIRSLRRKYGESSPLVYIALLCTIYTSGYYVKWDEDLILDIAEDTGIDEDEVRNAIYGCLNLGLFCKELFDEHQILTSHGIQNQFQSICRQSKRKSGIREYSLLPSAEWSIPNTDHSNGVSSELTPSKQRENPEFFPESPSQSKVKKSKVKESKENYSYYSLEEEKEEILSFCFFKNWAAPSKEYSKIIAYNNTGGRSWDSMTRTQKESALALWKQQPEQRPRLSPQFLSFWENIYTNLRSLNAPYEVRMDALSDSIAETIRGNTLFLHCTDRLRLFIERHLDVFKPIIRAYQSRFGLTQLNYTIFNHDYPDGKGLAQDPDAPA